MATTARAGMSSSRRMSWDILRVVAILFVVTGHVTGLAAEIPGIEPYPVRISVPFGTAALLVLSGYFIGPTLRGGEAGRWFRARLARLLPAYSVAVVMVYVVTRCVVVGFNGGRLRDGLFGVLFAAPLMPATPVAGALPAWHVPDLNDLLLHLFLLQEWNPDSWHRIDGSYWTLPVQVAAFAAAAVLWRHKLHHRVSIGVVLWTVMAVSAVSPLLRSLVTTLPDATGLYRAHLFAAGVSIWLWRQRRLSTKHLVLLLIATLVLQGFRSHPPVVGALVGLAIMLAAMCAAARGRDWDVPVLSALRRPISWLAGVSYCLYLVHQQLGYVLARALSEAGVSPWWLRLSIVVGCVLIVAWLLTVLVERPAYRALTRSRPAAGTTSSARPRVSVGGAA